MHTVIAGKPVKVAAVSDYALSIKLAAMELNFVLQRYMILLYIKLYTPLISSRYLLHRVLCVELHGTAYTRKAVIVYKYIDDMPVFGDIMDILSLQEENIYSRVVTYGWFVCSFSFL